MSAHGPVADGTQPAPARLSKPILLDAAWQTTLATHALVSMDFATAQDLARVYGKQRQLGEYTDMIMSMLVQVRSVAVGSCRSMLDEERRWLANLEQDHAAFLDGNEKPN